MKKDDKASVSLKKILILSILVIFSFSIVAFASNSKISTIQIKTAYPINPIGKNTATNKKIIAKTLALGSKR